MIKETEFTQQEKSVQYQKFDASLLRVRANAGHSRNNKAKMVVVEEHGKGYQTLEIHHFSLHSRQKNREYIKKGRYSGSS